MPMTQEPSRRGENGFTCPVSREDFCNEIEHRVERIAKEFSDGFAFISNYPKSVSFFGSSRFTPENPHCKKAEHLAGRIARELQYAVITGGSMGIMGAANKGAFEAGGESVGLNIKLPQEQYQNRYTTGVLEFSYFFARKTILSYAAEAYIFFPGGFGTLDELFEIITLVQTHKIRRVPVLLVGKEYWEPLNQFIRTYLFEAHKAVSEHDLDLYRITDEEDEIIETVRKAPISDGLHHRIERSLRGENDKESNEGGREKRV